MSGGFWGTIAVTILAEDTGIVFAWDADAFLSLLWNFTGAMAIFSWSAVMSFIMFGLMRAFNILRVNPTIEKKGLDIAKHGEPAYPLTAYGHGWDMDTYLTKGPETRIGLHFSMKSLFRICNSDDGSIEHSAKAPSISTINTIPDHIKREEPIDSKINGINSSSNQTHVSTLTVDAFSEHIRLEVSGQVDSRADGIETLPGDIDRAPSASSIDTVPEQIKLEEQQGSKVNYGMVFDKEIDSTIETPYKEA